MPLGILSCLYHRGHCKEKLEDMEGCTVLFFSPLLTSAATSKFYCFFPSFSRTKLQIHVRSHLDLIKTVSWISRENPSWFSVYKKKIKSTFLLSIQNRALTVHLFLLTLFESLHWCRICRFLPVFQALPNFTASVSSL